MAVYDEEKIFEVLLLIAIANFAQIEERQSLPYSFGKQISRNLLFNHMPHVAIIGTACPLKTYLIHDLVFEIGGGNFFF